ncbi:NnrS family protein [Phaeovulum sp.]|uniref:NnrS family protein n=1 Tax=Phaeovulum sp. TaxID=2934796 RepID=UPI0039E31462
MTLQSPIPDLRGIPPIEHAKHRVGLADVLTDEGFRLFFPLAALHAALWPFLWIAVQGYNLLGATQITSSVWHMHEMLYGSFGAALIGFLTTAFPEWTDTRPMRGRVLWYFAGAWGVARVIGLLGADLLTPLAALADLAWLGGLIAYAVWISWTKRTDRLLAFIGWLAAFALAEAVTRGWMISGASFEAAQAVKVAGLIFLGMLGLALARIGVPVTNLVLDPTEQTSPFRPHPGRLNLASGLVAVAIAGQVAGLSEAVNGWLLVAAGAGLLDRVGEGFVGRDGRRAEIVALWLPPALAGAGLLWLGAGQLGAPLAPAGGWHLALMGGLGLAVLAVMSIAGLFHSGHTLPVARPVKWAIGVMLASVMVRLAPELGVIDPFLAHLAASILWAAAFGLWLVAYWPLLSDPATLGKHEGC